MSKIIMVGCDLHDKNMLIRYAIGKGKPEQREFANESRSPFRWSA
ncbi:MAG: hypothetical protein AAF483_19320 [Planctomycetota bacterium]